MNYALRNWAFALATNALTLELYGLMGVLCG
jgi:hypothetical protein